jgi:hypothetical protein
VIARFSTSGGKPFQLATLGTNSIQITPLGVIRIGDIRCHRWPTMAQTLPKTLIGIKKC